jgi:hypothetical protein
MRIKLGYVFINVDPLNRRWEIAPVSFIDYFDSQQSFFWISGVIEYLYPEFPGDYYTYTGGVTPKAA